MEDQTFRSRDKILDGHTQTRKKIQGYIKFTRGKVEVDRERGLVDSDG